LSGESAAGLTVGAPVSAGLPVEVLLGRSMVVMIHTFF
jgi:hypothetical protein